MRDFTGDYRFESPDDRLFKAQITPELIEEIRVFFSPEQKIFGWKWIEKLNQIEQERVKELFSPNFRCSPDEWDEAIIVENREFLGNFSPKLTEWYANQGVYFESC